MQTGRDIPDTHLENGTGQNLTEHPLAEGMLEQRFLPNTSIYVTAEDGLLKLNSQEEHEALQVAEAETEPPKKGRKKADREPELSGAGAGPGGEGEK